VNASTSLIVLNDWVIVCYIADNHNFKLLHNFHGTMYSANDLSTTATEILWPFSLLLCQHVCDQVNINSTFSHWIANHPTCILWQQVLFPMEWHGICTEYIWLNLVFPTTTASLEFRGTIISSTVLWLLFRILNIIKWSFSSFTSKYYNIYQSTNVSYICNTNLQLVFTQVVQNDSGICKIWHCVFLKHFSMEWKDIEQLCSSL